MLRANQAGRVFSIEKVQEELSAYADELANWAAARPASFFLPADARVVTAASKVSIWVAGQSYEPQARADLFAKADYWLVAHALATGWTVVTHEVRAPASKKKIKIPDVCIGVGVTYTNPFQMLDDEGAVFVL